MKSRALCIHGVNKNESNILQHITQQITKIKLEILFAHTFVVVPSVGRNVLCVYFVENNILCWQRKWSNERRNSITHNGHAAIHSTIDNAKFTAFFRSIHTHTHIICNCQLTMEPKNKCTAQGPDIVAALTMHDTHTYAQCAY